MPLRFRLTGVYPGLKPALGEAGPFDEKDGVDSGHQLTNVKNISVLSEQTSRPSHASGIANVR
jgi:hypothetical protein